MNKILVIGGSGFIGTNLINQLVKNKNNQVLGTFFSKKKFFRNNKAKYFINIASNALNIFEDSKEKEILKNLTYFSLERKY